MRLLATLLFVLTGAAAQASQCPGPPARNGPSWNGWADAANTRFQDAKAAGLTSQTTPRLKLKWAFGFPGVTNAEGTPTVVMGRVFVGDANGVVYSLDAHTGCTYWTFTAAGSVRNSPVVGNGVYFGDLKGNVYSLDL